MAKQQLEIKTVGPGLKTINFDAFGGLDGFLSATSNGGAVSQPQAMRRVLPWLAKATDMTALAVSQLPFDLMQGDTVYDSSAKWANRLGGMLSPQTLLYNLAASLCLGQAYVIPTVTSRQVISLQYCAPQSVRPEITDDIEYFDRVTSFGAQTRYWPVGEIDEHPDAQMMYFWLPDSDVELGPAMSYPTGNALLASELLVSIDRTLAIYAHRGFVPPTILAAKGMGNQTERDKAEAWWNKFLRGWTNTIAKIINAEAMTVTKVGAGMDELRGIYVELNHQNIENIGTSFGIPAALFMSDMAFASEVNPMIKVWYTTSQFVKIYTCIEQTFNTQLLDRFGLRMVFRPETIDAFQEDEVQRADAFVKYTTAGIKPSIAAQMVGLELPEGVEYEDLDPEEKEPAPVPAALVPFAGQDNAPVEVEEPEDEEPEPMPADVEKWMRKATKRLKETGSAVCEFESAAISVDENERITEALPECKTAADVRRVFENKPVDQIKRALDWLEQHEVE
jgi:hypothetical protein